MHILYSSFSILYIIFGAETPLFGYYCIGINCLTSHCNIGVSALLFIKWLRFHCNNSILIVKDVCFLMFFCFDMESFLYAFFEFIGFGNDTR